MNKKNKNIILNSEEHNTFLKRIRMRKLMILTSRLLILIAFFAVWEVLAELKLIDSFITSQPSRILKTLGNLYREGTLFYHTGVTCFETMVGFLLGTIIGTIIAIILWWSDFLAKVLEPYLVVLNSLPKIALKINVGLSWVGVIVGEFLVSKAGLGYLIVYGGQVFQLDLVMTTVLILALAAAVMYQCVVYLEKLLIKSSRHSAV